MEKKRKIVKLTVALSVPISPALKEAVDRAAMAEKIPTNEWVARHLAEVLNQPELAEIPRKAFGRPRLVKAASA